MFCMPGHVVDQFRSLGATQYAVMPNHTCDWLTGAFRLDYMWEIVHFFDHDRNEIGYWTVITENKLHVDTKGRKWHPDIIESYQFFPI